MLAWNLECFVCSLAPEPYMYLYMPVLTVSGRKCGWEDESPNHCMVRESQEEDFQMKEKVCQPNNWWWLGKSNASSENPFYFLHLVEFTNFVRISLGIFFFSLFYADRSLRAGHSFVTAWACRWKARMPDGHAECLFFVLLSMDRAIAWDFQLQDSDLWI